MILDKRYGPCGLGLRCSGTISTSSSTKLSCDFELNYIIYIPSTYRMSDLDALFKKGDIDKIIDSISEDDPNLDKIINIGYDYQDTLFKVLYRLIDIFDQDIIDKAVSNIKLRILSESQSNKDILDTNFDTILMKGNYLPTQLKSLLECLEDILGNIGKVETIDLHEISSRLNVGFPYYKKI